MYSKVEAMMVTNFVALGIMKLAASVTKQPCNTVSLSLLMNLFIISNETTRQDSDVRQDSLMKLISKHHRQYQLTYGAHVTVPISKQSLTGVLACYKVHSTQRNVIPLQSGHEVDILYMCLHI